MTINIYITTNQKDNTYYYGSILQWRYHQKLLIKGFDGKSENEVLLQGLIETLESVHDKSKNIKIDTDNKYIYDSIKYKRYNMWYENGWQKSDGDMIAYVDEWQHIRDLILEFNNVAVSHPFTKRIELLKGLILEKEGV